MMATFTRDQLIDEAARRYGQPVLPPQALQVVALDYAVALCLGYELSVDDDERRVWVQTPANFGWLDLSYRFSSSWEQGGPIIEAHRIQTYWHVPLQQWGGRCKEALRYGATPLVAAMRSYVAANLGEQVEIPRAIVDAGSR